MLDDISRIACTHCIDAGYCCNFVRWRGLCVHVCLTVKHNCQLRKKVELFMVPFWGEGKFVWAQGIIRRIPNSVSRGQSGQARIILLDNGHKESLDGQSSRPRTQPMARSKRVTRRRCGLSLPLLQQLVCLPYVHMYTVSQRKQDTKLLAITSPTIIRFWNFFHQRTRY